MYNTFAVSYDILQQVVLYFPVSYNNLQQAVRPTNCNVPSLGTLELFRRAKFAILNLTMLLGDLLLKVKLISHVVTRGRGGIRRFSREKLKSHRCEDKWRWDSFFWACLIYYSDFQFSLVRAIQEASTFSPCEDVASHVGKQWMQTHC